jgi:hypothetical protein
VSTEVLIFFDLPTLDMLQLCWISAVDGRLQPASCVVLGDFPHSQHRPSVTHIGLRLPVIRGIERRRWTFHKADWASFNAATEHSIPLIPVNNIEIEEAYQRFTGALLKAAHSSIPRGFHPTYIPCMMLGRRVSCPAEAV